MPSPSPPDSMGGMDPLFLIIGLVVLVLLVAIVLLVVGGKKHGESKTISFDKPEEQRELTQQEKSGNYQAKGGFNFSAAGDSPAGFSDAPRKEPVLRDDQELPLTAPSQPASAEPSIPVTREAPKTEAPEASRGEQPDVASLPEAQGDTPVADDVAAELQASESAHAAPDSSVSDDRLKAATEGTEQPAAESTKQGDDTSAPAHAEALEAAAAAAAAAASAEAARERTEAATERPEPGESAPASEPEPQIEDIAPTSGRIGRLRGRLSRSQGVIGKSVLGILSAGDLDEDAWEEIEDTLIMADLGTKVTMDVVEALREKIAERGVASEAEARAMLRETLIEACKPEMDRSIRAMPYDGKPAVVLVVGVNGTGKTTTTGKIARVLVAQGHTVLLGAADTFRAAAADQLETWGSRVGATTVRGAEGADPASVAFDAVARGVEEHADVVLIDTAGRLHTSVGLMDQLGKVKRVVEKKAQVDEVLLVLDATVGQNGLVQARTFRDVVDISGLVLTKLDGSAKGGIVFQVQEELGVPVKMVGLGEGADDLAPFEVEGFVDALLGS